MRLRAENGYRAERSYSIASPPDVSAVQITVDCVEDGEVSPFLTDELMAGDRIEVRGPIGGHFAWSVSETQDPLLLVGGGSGVAPLMCMLRHRRLRGSSVPAALLYSARTYEDVIYREELAEMAQSDPELLLEITLTRESPSDWSGSVGRIQLRQVRALIEHLGRVANAFVCGGDSFVESTATLLLQAGQPAEFVRTERFGAKEKA
ncbi:MAG TPA: FAD-binding oxidoreductase [Bryobacteraceae bacterium]|nr:FAD-binding oxidoreductase [Bryobacteraceae bacterium]